MTCQWDTVFLGRELPLKHGPSQLVASVVAGGAAMSLLLAPPSLLRRAFRWIGSLLSRLLPKRDIGAVTGNPEGAD